MIETGDLMYLKHTDGSKGLALVMSPGPIFSVVYPVTTDKVSILMNNEGLYIEKGEGDILIVRTSRLEKDVSLLCSSNIVERYLEKMDGPEMPI